MLKHAQKQARHVVIGLSSVGTIATIVGGVVTSIVGVRRVTQKNERLRHRISSDLELRGMLPEGSAAQQALDKHIEESIDVLVQIQNRQLGGTTDPYGLIWAAIFFGMAIGAGVWAYQTPYRTLADVAIWVFAGFAMVTSAIALVAARKDDTKEEDLKSK